MQLDTSINQQVANDLRRLLAIITDMYVKVAEGIQLDFIRMKVPQKELSAVDLQKFYSAQPITDLKAISTAPGTIAHEKAFEMPELEQKVKNVNIAGESGGSGRALGAEFRDSFASSERGPSEFDTQGSTGHTRKLDTELKLTFNVSDLEFSSILMSQDAYIVEAVLAGWFADAAKWIRHSEIHWRDALFDREAEQAASATI
ncbi:hypothetical protein ABW21_db0206254 [Orbilia brochopaga]|nr:hypothetical protein ABW21_db0206254 [Drechslerella brochopaga]